MRQREINITGRITSEGKLSLYMHELNAFAQEWKNTRIVATFRVYQPGTSAALRGYYYNYVVPSVRRALWEDGERKSMRIYSRNMIIINDLKRDYNRL